MQTLKLQKIEQMSVLPHLFLYEKVLITRLSINLVLIQDELAML